MCWCRAFTAEFSALQEIILFVKDALGSRGVTDDDLRIAHVVCDECITNIINHAYCGDVPVTRRIGGVDYARPLTVSCSGDRRRVVIEITDWGVPFNPLEYEGDMTGTGAHGGFGIFLTRSLASRVEYRREEGKNVLTLVIGARDEQGGDTG